VDTFKIEKKGKTFIHSGHTSNVKYQFCIGNFVQHVFYFHFNLKSLRKLQ